MLTVDEVANRLAMERAEVSGKPPWLHHMSAAAEARLILAHLAGHPTTELLDRCPEPGCDLPAELVDVWVADSTSGPVLHVETRCPSKHRLTRPIG